MRPDPADPERFLIIVGERRWRASQIAGKTRIRAVVHQMDEYAVRAAQYAENNKRADVSDVSRARSLQAMYDEERKRGGGWAEVAAASGITRMHVSRLTSLLRLPDAVVEMIDRKLLASAHGAELVRVVSHITDEEVVQLAASCRKPKRGEAFARSVESLREEVNEILAHVQRPARPGPRLEGDVPAPQGPGAGARGRQVLGRWSRPGARLGSAGVSLRGGDPGDRHGGRIARNGRSSAGNDPAPRPARRPGDRRRVSP